MAAHRDSEFPSHGENDSSAVIPGSENNFYKYVRTLDYCQDSDLDARNGENSMTCGDSGFSEMELTSSGSDAAEPEKQSISSMEVLNNDDDDDDISSTISEISGMSGFSSEDWAPTRGPFGWVQRQMQLGTDPRQVLNKLVGNEASLSAIPANTENETLWKVIINLLTEIPWRKKLPDVNTLDDVVDLIRRSNKILVLTGAGVSVSCGIPDFRSPQGIYARLARDFPDLPNPHAMFDIRYFNRDPRPFFKFAREIYPGQFQPSPCHKFIRALETHGKLLRNYTQNIDTLEQVAGIQRVVQCHGSFATATCTNCKRKVGASEIRDDIMAQRIPVCTVCVPDAGHEENVDYSGLVERGVMKPDIVFFGEGLPEDFHRAMTDDRDQADLLLIIGSSLKVQPVALIPSSVPSKIPQVLINREPLPDQSVDVELLGDADVLVDHLCRALGDNWTDLCWRDAPLVGTQNLLPEDLVYSTTSVGTNQQEKLTNDRKRPASRDSSPGPDLNKRARIDEDDDDDENDGWRDPRHIKIRQMSSDSTRDSGIAEPVDERPPLSLSARLPINSYYFMPPNRYVFPGAEVYSMRHRRRPSFNDSDLESSGQESGSLPPSPSINPIH